MGSELAPTGGRRVHARPGRRGGGVVLVVGADGPRLVSAVRGVSAVRAVGLVASEGTEAGTVSGIHAAPTFRPEGVSARTPCSREIPRQTVVEGEDP